MILPPVYRTIRTPQVAAMVGDRIGRHGDIPPDELRPYIVWQLVVGNPHDHLSGAPVSDMTTVQIDCYATGDGQVEALASAVRNALDAALICNRITVNRREPGTRLYRISIDADFITQR